MQNLNQITAELDAAQRISDCVSLHLVVATDIMQEAVGMWAAFKLEDGTSDNNLYPTKEIAISKQKGIAKNYCYLKITPDGISRKDAMHFLRANRNQMVDTTAPEHVVNPKIFLPSASVFNNDPRPGVDSE